MMVDMKGSEDPAISKKYAVYMMIISRKAWHWLIEN
jgi:hypothetical protein